MPLTRPFVPVTALLTTALLAGCGSSGGGSTSSGTSTPSSSGAGALSVKEADFSLTPKDVTVSKAGHMVAGDQNDVFTSVVADFLDRLVGRWP